MPVHDDFEDKTCLLSKWMLHRGSFWMTFAVYVFCSHCNPVSSTDGEDGGTSGKMTCKPNFNCSVKYSDFKWNKFHIKYKAGSLKKNPLHAVYIQVIICIQWSENSSVCFPLCSYNIKKTKARRSQLRVVSEDAPFNSQLHLFGKWGSTGVGSAGGAGHLNQSTAMDLGVTTSWLRPPFFSTQ